MEEKRIFVINNNYEYNLLLNVLNEYRNQLLKTGKSTAIVNEMLLRLIHTQSKRRSIFKRERVCER